MRGSPGCVVWFTGIPGAGKTTLARALEKRLVTLGVDCDVLDADEVRAVLSPNLGYTPEARDENTRRLAWVASRLAGHGIVSIVAAVSPERRHRDRARCMFPRFVEVHVQCTLETARRRDPKGLYARVDRGEAHDVAGLHYPHEAPQAPEVACDTERDSVEACVARILDALRVLHGMPIPQPRHA